MLKEQGGSGTINPTTGLPEFQEMDFGMFAEAPQQAFDPGTSYEAYAEPAPPPVTGGGMELGAPLPPITTTTEVAPPPGFGFTVPEAPGAQTAITGPSAATAAELASQAPVAAGVQDPNAPQQPQQERGYFERLGSALRTQLADPATLARLGLGLGVGGLGALQAQRGAQATRRSRAELAAIGEPYRQQGRELIEQARRGELSPASAQAMQAAQARTAQATARSGGVGAMQGAAQLERLRAQLLQNQYQLGLNVANIGDQYLRGAIQTGMRANQQLQQATNQFYGMLTSVLAGPTGQAISAAARV